MNEHAYCRNCETIRSFRTSVMGGDDVSGNFTNATDLVCNDCHWVIATTYTPKALPSGGANK
jgi:hypothetical protein